MKKRFTGNTRLFLGISGVIIVVALIMQICGVGLNLGIDFTGGSILEYSVGEDYDVSDVEAVLSSVGFSDAQITKAAPSEASENLQANLAAETAAETTEETAAETTEETAAETTEETAAETTEETAAETTEETAAEETTEVAASILSLDKSGITADGRTDLQIRLVLKDEAAGMQECVTKAMEALGATSINTATLTYKAITDNSYDSAYTGGYVMEFDMGGDFDKAAVETAVNDALAAGGYSINKISFTKYDDTAAAETAEETAAETAEETTDEQTAGDASAEEAATEAPAEEATEAPAEEAAAEEATEAPAEEATEAPAEEAAAEETAEEAVTEEAAVEETGTKVRILIDLNDVTTQVRTVLEREMVAKYPNFRFVSIDHVSAIAGKDLLSNAVKALLIAFVCMLIYIGIRFDLMSGLAALAALLHDCLIMLSFMIFFRAFFQANSSFIAAILTIVGYSINNTIIIFDRIRENVKTSGMSELPRMEIVEISVSSTLARTINTTLTTMITLVALYVFGVSSIREFAFPLIVGMLAGTYSSVLLSGQVWAMWTEKLNAKKAASAPKAATVEVPVKKVPEKKPVEKAYAKSFKKK